MMIYALLWFVCALVAAAIGSKKGETLMGFIVGIIFGPLGILVALLSRGNRVPCPHCKEPMNRTATVCPHCRTPLSPA